MRKLFALLATSALLLGLTACFGGGEEPTTTTEPVTSEQTITAEPEATTQVVEVVTDPDFDAEALFKRLEGVWDIQDEGPDGPIFHFMSFLYHDGKPSKYSGAYEGETSGVGTLVDGRENEDGTATLYFLYPAYDYEDGPVPERTEALQIDMTGLQDGKLRVQITTIWRTYDWETYTYRCKTLREAGIIEL